MDGRLSTREGGVLELHLGTCPACRLAAERLQRAWNALGTLEGVGAAPDDWTALEAAAQATRRGRMSLRRWWQLAPAPAPAPAAWTLAGMIVLGAAGGVLVSRAARPPDRVGSIEARMFAETLGELPWGSPAAGLAGVIDTRTPEEGTP